jgi:hypothetical protein
LNSGLCTCKICALSHQPPLQPFLLRLFGDSLAFCLGQSGPQSPYFMLSATAGMIGLSHHAQLFSIDLESLKLFLFRLAWNHSPPNLNLPSNLGWEATTVPSYWLRSGSLELFVQAGLEPWSSPF